jgi:uncharacterized protein (TIGR02680 family)
MDADRRGGALRTGSDEMIPLARHPSRFRLARAGIHQVWQYDDEFVFGDGRLLLRGTNGAGKSKALEMLLPFLLDGDTRRLDAAGGGKTSLKWLMLDGWTAGTNRLGYLWAEFTRVDDEGETCRLTLGAMIKASTSTGEARAAFFVTPLEVGDDLPLHDPGRRPSAERARDLVGHENWYERAAEFRARVARDLFGLTDLARYRNLIHLLYGLRRPTIGDRIESGELVKVLSDALPPLDDDVLDKIARNLDDLDSVRDELARLEKTNTALTTFLKSYRGYLHGVLRDRIGLAGAALAELGVRRRNAGDAERKLTRLRIEESSAEQAVTVLQEARDAGEADLRALRESAAYGALRDLRDKRTAVQAVADAAGTAWSAAGVARNGEAAAAERLRDEAAEIGTDLADMRSALRDARRGARVCGVDEELLGEPAAVRPKILSPSVTEQLTDVGGAVQEVIRPAVEVVDPQIALGLAAWRTELTESDLVLKGRLRAAAMLDARLKEAALAERQADDLRQQAERLDAQLAGARSREDERGRELVASSQRYAEDVRSWAQRLPEPAPVMGLCQTPDDPDLSAAERALGRDVPESVAQLAHEIVGPVLDVYDSQRDEAVERERSARRDLDAARAKKRGWEEQADPELPRSHYSTAEHAPGTGAPLFLLVDYADSVPEVDRPGLEAALEASGLLAAWACADGTLLASDTRDVILRADDPVPGLTLASVLRPISGHGVSQAALDRLLRCVGLGESAAPSWVSPDGRWRLGVTSGAYGKDKAEYIGAAVRAATRQNRIDELTAHIEALQAELAAAATARKELERLRDGLRRALREAPRGRALTDAWTAYHRAVEESARLGGELLTARREAEQAVAVAVSLRTRAEAQATSEGLPADRDLLGRLQADLDGLRKALDGLGRDAGRTLTRLETHARTTNSFQIARRDRLDAERGYAEAYAKLAAARRELEVLEGSVGATEQEIIAREREAQSRFDHAMRGLPRARDAYQHAHDEAVRAERDRDQAAAMLSEQEHSVVAGGVSLRRPLALPGLPLAAGLGDVDPVLHRYDAAQEGEVRARIAALRTLADDISAVLGPASADVSASLIIRRGEELRDSLAGGYDAEGDEVEGIKRYALRDDTGAHDVAVVGARIRAAAEEARNRLSAREQEVFERYLLGELGDHLSRQMLAAETLIKGMNDTLDEVRSSHGVGARLQWDLSKDGDADTKAAVALLRRPSALRAREQSAQLRDALRRRIEAARLADPSAGYALHLRAALDYRAWFEFKVKVTETANPDRERVLSHRTALSQGEQRVVSYLVLFATAAAHFSSVGANAPQAPRLILLDDAFAKVDEPTHGRLLGLLVELDLDFIITSERLWGCFATVPSLHIYECLRDPHARGVAVVHFTWDGHRKRLVGV